MLLSFTIFYLLSLAFSQSEQGPIVYTPSGLISGRTQISRNGTEFYSFKGIHYAKAPKGKLRFKPPVPAEPWKDIFSATWDGPTCEMFQPEGIRSDDCLRLNVYTRRVNEAKVTRPVLVFIPGGNFHYSSGRSWEYGPDYLMDHDIVLVTINYRLGTSGFLSTGDEYAPGNYGLKDQVEALKWVKKNIQFFGGDPTQVTISGENAGAASVGLHLISPMSKGLFHGAIMLNGSPTNPWVVNKNPMKYAKKQAEWLNCTADDSEKLIKCLSKIKGEALEGLYSRLFEWPYGALFNSPVIEAEVEGQPRFLEKDPLISILEGEIADVPVFIGTTRNEKLYQAYSILQNASWTEDLSENWTSLIPKLCLYEPNDEISEKLREFYLGDLDKPITNESLDGLSNLLSDAHVIYGAIQFAKLISQKNTKPVYLYQYNYSGKGLNPFFRMEWDQSDRLANAFDRYYLFYSQVYFPVKFKNNTEDGKIVTKLTTLWKNFVETGNPTPEPSAILDNVTWEPYKNENARYLNINETLKVENGLYFEERISLWESLFPLPEKN